MPITQRFSVMCDELRQENNGKFLIFGMYTPDMSVPQLPFLVPVLTFVNWLQVDRPGNWQFNARLVHLESGAVLAQAMGGFQILAVNPGSPGLLPIRLQNVQFSQAGAYTLSLQIQNEQEIQHHFQIILAAPMIPGVGMPGLPPR